MPVWDARSLLLRRLRVGMIKSEQTDLVFSCLVAVQAEVGAIPKTSTNPFFKSKYADLATAKQIADPIATQHGLAVVQFPAPNDQLLTMAIHTSGQYIGEYMDLHLVKNDPQSSGSAITYARRYAYMAALGLVADDDDDGNLASRPTERPQGHVEAAFREAEREMADPSERPFTVDDPLDATDPGPLVIRKGKLKSLQRVELNDWCKTEGMPDHPVKQTPEQRALFAARLDQMENI